MSAVQFCRCNNAFYNVADHLLEKQQKHSAQCGTSYLWEVQTLYYNMMVKMNI